jgi:hypothetical protein
MIVDAFGRDTGFTTCTTFSPPQWSIFDPPLTLWECRWNQSSGGGLILHDQQWRSPRRLLVYSHSGAYRLARNRWIQPRFIEVVARSEKTKERIETPSRKNRRHSDRRAE